jgi:tRNA (guanine37-N1)-methyltransferase
VFPPQASSLKRQAFMRFDILTLFPGMFTGPLTESILKRAQQAGLLRIALHDIRSYATDRHKTTDDYPFGGGAGMVMKPEVLYQALADVLGVGEAARSEPDELIALPDDRPPVLLMTPAGEQFTQRIAEELAQYDRLVLICGHYEGIDERFRERCVDREISIGDYVLTGGELAAMVIVDAVARLKPGVLAEESTAEESHSDALLEYPHYTRPATWRGQSIPDVLLSGHHANVARWRRQQRLLRTLQRRPDLLREARLSAHDEAYLRLHGWGTDEQKPDPNAAEG